MAFGARGSRSMVVTILATPKDLPLAPSTSPRNTKASTRRLLTKITRHLGYSTKLSYDRQQQQQQQQPSTRSALEPL